MPARAALAALLGGGEVRLYEVRQGEFGGRVRARVETPAGQDAAAALIAAGLGRAYAGRAREDWCGG